MGSQVLNGGIQNEIDFCPKINRLEGKYVWQLKFGLSEKGTKFEKIFHLKFDVTE